MVNGDFYKKITSHKPVNFVGGDLYFLIYMSLTKRFEIIELIKVYKNVTSHNVYLPIFLEQVASFISQ